MDWSWLLFALAAVMVLVGVAGTVLPALPGPVLVLLGLLLAAWTEDFVHAGAWTVTTWILLTGLTFLVDFAATALGAKRLGASRRAAVGAALGTLLGMFFGPWGLILGPFLGAVIAELTVHRDVGRAGRAGVGAWIGFVLGGLGKLVLVGAMLASYAWSRWT